MNKTNLKTVLKDLQVMKEKIGSDIRDPFISFFDGNKLTMHFMGKKLNKTSHEVIEKEVQTKDPEQYFKDHDLHGVIITGGSDLED